jgi:hypothetical protein
MFNKSTLDLEKKKANEERKKKAEAFFEEYKKISAKYELDLAAIIRYHENGIYPKVIIVDTVKEQKNEHEPKS